MENINCTKKALELISEAVAILSAKDKPDSTSLSNPMQLANTSSTTLPSTSTSTSTSGTSSGSEMSKLFPAMFRAKSALNIKSRRWLPYKIKESWTHNFVAIPSTRNFASDNFENIDDSMSITWVQSDKICSALSIFKTMYSRS